MRVIPKNARESIRLQMSEFRGTAYLDVRVWVDAGAGEARPTPKGVTVPMAVIPEFIDAVAAVGREARSQAA